MIVRATRKVDEGDDNLTTDSHHNENQEIADDDDTIGIVLKVPRDAERYSQVVNVYLKEMLQANNNEMLMSNRLIFVFSEFFKWRNEVTRERGGSIGGMDGSNAELHDTIPLFPEQLRSEGERLLGRDRNLGQQMKVMYEGHSKGIDSIGVWQVYPLGMLCEAMIVRPKGYVKTLVPEISSVEIQLVDFDHEQQCSAREKLMELHKIDAFFTWFEQRIRRISLWQPFPMVDNHRDAALRDEGDDFSPTETERGVVNKLQSCETEYVLESDSWPFIEGNHESLAARNRWEDAQGKDRIVLHKGMLFWGPAGTGKSRAVGNIVDFFRMNCVWGYNRDNNKSIVGSGAVLKGQLQGDLEMRIKALFMRGNAAPWLPTAISIDEIDFTAPSRESDSSESSGGNSWLHQLSDNVRAPNVVFMATTNLRSNVLEQLVDRLEEVFVGLLSWENFAQLLDFRAWPANTDVGRLLREGECEGLDGFQYRKLHSRLLGMTPRQVRKVKTLKDVGDIQRTSNVWPTHVSGLLPFEELVDDAAWITCVHDCTGTLFKFLVWAHHKRCLSGRVLVDTTRLRDRVIIVEVEVIRAKVQLGYADVYDERHVFHKHHLGDGATFVRTFVLHEQDDERGVWSVLAFFAVHIRAYHCSYVSDEFLHASAGASHMAADERNRKAIELTIRQYVTEVTSGVLVLPLRYARIQKPENLGSSFASSNINASEVWDLITNDWRCDGNKDQLFVLVATEKWEIDSIRGSDTVAWQTTAYREHIEACESDDVKCERCDRSFSANMSSDQYGCQHDGRVAMFEPGAKEDWKTCAAVGAQVVVEHTTRNPDYAFRAKWMCCGKGFLDRECPNREHVSPTSFEEMELLVNGGHTDVNNDKRWWCNHCCDSRASESCHYIE